MTTGGDTSEAGNAETTNDPHTDGDTISNTMPTGGDTSEKSAIDDEVEVKMRIRVEKLKGASVGYNR